MSTGPSRKASGVELGHGLCHSPRGHHLGVAGMAALRGETYARYQSAKKRRLALAAVLATVWSVLPVQAADEPDLIFKRSTVFKLLTPNDKLATYGLDDREVEGVACHFTVPERGGLKGGSAWPKRFRTFRFPAARSGRSVSKKFEQGEDMFRQRRSLFFKKMQIVRGCDTKRNVLVYMVYSDKLIEGSPKNSTSSVPMMPWGSNDPVAKCADWVER